VILLLLLLLLLLDDQVEGAAVPRSAHHLRRGRVEIQGLPILGREALVCRKVCRQI